MVVLTLPEASKPTVVVGLIVEAWAVLGLVSHGHRSLWLCLIAFLAGAFISDWLSGLAHFGFDYVWPPRAPVMGPIAVDFRRHHERPTLDPSALLINLTKGVYAALPLGVIAGAFAWTSADTTRSFFIAAVLVETSLWMLGFHQIHSYAHMGSQLSPEEFNRAVAAIDQLPTRRQQRQAFARLFASMDIPVVVRWLQRCRLFLRPEIHWRHHIAFETDFSSVNGWSDPAMNWLYRRVARARKATALARVAVAAPGS